MPKGPFQPCDSLPSERARGLVWASVFRSAADEVAKGGVITGTPTINHGATLNGTTDYITYALNGQLNLGTIGIHCEFWPDFDYDEDASRYLFNTTNLKKYYLLKDDNAASNVLTISLGNTTITNIAAATYSALWNQSGRNLITISGTTGATDAWLNGTQILTAGATAWTAAAPTTLYVGSKHDTTEKFDGKITRLQFYNTLLTSGEHLDVWESGKYSW